MEAPQAVMAPPTKSNPDLRKTQANTSLDSLKRGEAPVTPPGAPLKEIYFAFDKHDLSTDARATLQGNSVWLKKIPRRESRSKVTATSVEPANTIWRSAPSGPKQPKITL